MFAVMEVNKDLVLLPNITLGFRIYENQKMERKIFLYSLSLLSTRRKMVPGYKCDRKDPLLSVIGGHNSESSRQMASIFSIYKIPQVRGFVCGVHKQPKHTQKPRKKTKVFGGGVAYTKGV